MRRWSRSIALGVLVRSAGEAVEMPCRQHRASSPAVLTVRNPLRGVEMRSIGVGQGPWRQEALAASGGPSQARKLRGVPRSLETGSDDRPELGLRDYARIVWRRKLIAVVTAFVALAAAYAVDSRRVPLYEGTSTLLLTPELSPALNAATGGNTGASAVDAPTAVKVLGSQTIRRAAADLLKLRSVPPALASQQGTTSVVNVAVQSTDPVFAAKVANAYANAYITEQRTQAVNSLLDASTQISTRIGALDTELASVQQQIGAITAQEVPAPTSSGVPGLPVPTPAQAAQLTSLDLRQTTLNSQEGTFKQQLAQMQVAINLAGGGGQLVSAASVNRTPVSPHKFRDELLAFAIGLAFGLGLALLRDFLDDRIRSEDDLRRAVGGLPALGLIPTVEDWRNAKSTKLASVDAPSSPAAEAYRELRTALKFMSLDRPIRYLLVVSPVSGDGKTTTVANLAVNMVQAGQSVVAICCDLRRPRLHEFFGLSNDVGLTSVLLGESSLEDALQEVPGFAGLRLLAAGPIPPNPSELLSSRSAANVMSHLGEISDIVVIDTPPVLPVTDATVMAAQSDAVILIASANKTHRRAAGRAVELLGRVNARLVGVVVNNVPRNDRGYSYGYGYGYGYGKGYYGSTTYEPTHSQSRYKNGPGETNGKVRAPETKAAEARTKDPDGGVPLGDVPTQSPPEEAEDTNTTDKGMGSVETIDVQAPTELPDALTESPSAAHGDG
jgi:succinoglycan biosynthesis transport protein ExoP